MVASLPPPLGARLIPSFSLLVEDIPSGGVGAAGHALFGDRGFDLEILEIVGWTAGAGTLFLRIVSGSDFAGVINAPVYATRAPVGRSGQQTLFAAPGPGSYPITAAVGASNAVQRYRALPMGFILPAGDLIVIANDVGNQRIVVAVWCRHGG